MRGDRTDEGTRERQVHGNKVEPVCATHHKTARGYYVPASKHTISELRVFSDWVGAGGDAQCSSLCFSLDGMHNRTQRRVTTDVVTGRGWLFSVSAPTDLGPVQRVDHPAKVVVSALFVGQLLAFLRYSGKFHVGPNHIRRV